MVRNGSLLKIVKTCQITHDSSTHDQSLDTMMYYASSLPCPNHSEVLEWYGTVACTLDRTGRDDGLKSLKPCWLNHTSLHCWAPNHQKRSAATENKIKRNLFVALYRKQESQFPYRQPPYHKFGAVKTPARCI